MGTYSLKQEWIEDEKISDKDLKNSEKSNARYLAWLTSQVKKLELEIARKEGFAPHN